MNKSFQKNDQTVTDFYNVAHPELNVSELDIDRALEDLFSN